MPISKLGQRRQVVIPKEICEELGLEVGDFVEVEQVRNTVVRHSYAAGNPSHSKN
jgi:AbrB family looped-hinge helix DNA binding protein